ncbi:hypothetical protein [Prosthecobacter algae]
MESNALNAALAAKQQRRQELARMPMDQKVRTPEDGCSHPEEAR